MAEDNQTKISNSALTALFGDSGLPYKSEVLSRIQETAKLTGISSEKLISGINSVAKNVAEENGHVVNLAGKNPQERSNAIDHQLGHVFAYRASAPDLAAKPAVGKHTAKLAQEAQAPSKER